MERNRKNFGEGVKTFGRVCSVALRQARQSEIDVLAKGRIRERHGAGEEFFTHVRHTGAHGSDGVGRASERLRTIRRCWTEASRQSTQSEMDVLARWRFRAFHEPGASNGVVPEDGLPEEGRGYPRSHPGQAAHSLQGTC